MQTVLSRTLIAALLLCVLFAYSGEDVVAPPAPPSIYVSGQAGTPLEFATGLSSVSSIRSALPAGLRISDSGVLLGTPLNQGNTQIDTGGQQLLISILSADGAATRAAASAITVVSPLTASPNPAAPGATVTLSVAVSGNLLSYRWNFGDGTTAKGASSSVTHSYAAAGNYQATVTAGDGTNSVVSTTTVTVGGASVARAITPKPKVPSVKANPFDTIQVSAGTTGTPLSFDLANHEYSLGFVFSKGKKSKTGTTPDIIAKVPLIYDDSTGNTLSVMVPPFFKSSWSSGHADTFVITDGVMSDVPAARTAISKLIKPVSKIEGLVTISWIRANQTILTSSQSTLSNPAVSAFIDPKIATDNANAATQLGNIITNLQTLGKGSKDKGLILAAKQSDAFITSMLSAGARVSDTGFATACKDLLAAMSKATSTTDTALTAAETEFANALLHAAGARSAGGRGLSISDGLKFTLAVLTVTVTSVAVVAVATGATVATGAAAVAAAGTAAVAISVTVTVTVATAGATALIAGATGGGQQATANGQKLLSEAKQIAKDTAVNYVKENLPGNIIGSVTSKITSVTGTSQAAANIVNSVTSINDSVTDLQSVTPLVLTNSGALTGGVIPSGGSYYFKIVGPATDTISGSISGTDGFSVTYSGTGSVISPIIPAGATGVIDTLTGTDVTTSYTATLGTFKF